MGNKIVSIHQPNFFPWLGYFNKIVKADVFIILDNVQFPKTGGSWTNRVKIIVKRNPEWITVPIVRSYHGLKKINQIKINNTVNWRGKILGLIEQNYRRTDHYQKIFPLFAKLINYKTDYLFEFNLYILKQLFELLHISWSKCILSSTLSVESKATDMLIDLVQAVNGTAYLCGGGAEGYQEDKKFVNAKIKLIYQNYQEPVYPQLNTVDYAYGLSIIDVLMNCGVENTKKLIMG